MRVTGLSDLEREQAWEAAWRSCNQRQHDAMRNVCRRAYPTACPFTIPVLGVPDPVRCPLWVAEKAMCLNAAQGYFAAVSTVSAPVGVSGLERFKQRQMDYCAVP